jgi:hypothetical protein
MPERRQYVRLPMPDLPAILFVNDVGHPVCVRDVSLAGAKIIGKLSGLEVGCPLRLEMALGKYRTLACSGKIVRVESNDAGLVAGVLFTDLQPEMIRRIIRFLASLYV